MFVLGFARVTESDTTKMKLCRLKSLNVPEPDPDVHGNTEAQASAHCRAAHRFEG